VTHEGRTKTEIVDEEFPDCHLVSAPHEYEEPPRRVAVERSDGLLVVYEDFVTEFASKSAVGANDLVYRTKRVLEPTVNTNQTILEGHL
jgi:hypothetical protein